MATTKRRTTGTTRKTSSRKQDAGLAARAARTIRDRPYASAAIATGAVTAVAAAAAGAFFFSRRDRSEEKAQSDIAAEALTLKEIGEKAPHPADPMVEGQLKAGAVTH